MPKPKPPARQAIVRNKVGKVQARRGAKRRDRKAKTELETSGSQLNEDAAEVQVDEETLRREREEAVRRWREEQLRKYPVAPDGYIPNSTVRKILRPFRYGDTKQEIDPAKVLNQDITQTKQRTTSKRDEVEVKSAGSEKRRVTSNTRVVPEPPTTPDITTDVPTQIRKTSPQPPISDEDSNLHRPTTATVGYVDDFETIQDFLSLQTTQLDVLVELDTAETAEDFKAHVIVEELSITQRSADQLETQTPETKLEDTDRDVEGPENQLNVNSRRPAQPWIPHQPPEQSMVVIHFPSGEKTSPATGYKHGANKSSEATTDKPFGAESIQEFEEQHPQTTMEGAENRAVHAEGDDVIQPSVQTGDVAEETKPAEIVDDAQPTANVEANDDTVQPDYTEVDEIEFPSMQDIPDIEVEEVTAFPQQDDNSNVDNNLTPGVEEQGDTEIELNTSADNSGDQHVDDSIDITALSPESLNISGNIDVNPVAPDNENNDVEIELNAEVEVEETNGELEATSCGVEQSETGAGEVLQQDVELMINLSTNRSEPDWLEGKEEDGTSRGTLVAPPATPTVTANIQDWSLPANDRQASASRLSRDQSAKKRQHETEETLRNQSENDTEVEGRCPSLGTNENTPQPSPDKRFGEIDDDATQMRVEKSPSRVDTDSVLAAPNMRGLIESVRDPTPEVESRGEYGLSGRKTAAEMSLASQRSVTPRNSGNESRHLQSVIVRKKSADRILEVKQQLGSSSERIYSGLDVGTGMVTFMTVAPPESPRPPPISVVCRRYVSHRSRQDGNMAAEPQWSATLQEIELHGNGKDKDAEKSQPVAAKSMGLLPDIVPPCTHRHTAANPHNVARRHLEPHNCEYSALLNKRMHDHISISRHLRNKWLIDMLCDLHTPMNSRTLRDTRFSSA